MQESLYSTSTSPPVLHDSLLYNNNIVSSFSVAAENSNDSIQSTTTQSNCAYPPDCFPESSNLSGWIGLIDELIDQSPDHIMNCTSPMRDVPPISPTFSNLTDPLSVILSTRSSPSISFDSLTTKNDHHDNLLPSPPFSPLQSSHQKPYLPAASSSFPYFMSAIGLPQQQPNAINPKVASGSDLRSTFPDSTNSLRKAVSAPQLNQLDHVKTRKRRSVPSLSFPQACCSPTDIQPTLCELLQSLFSPKNSFRLPETNEFTTTFPRTQSLTLSTSPPSLDYVSPGMGGQSGISPMTQSMHRRTVSLQQNTTLMLKEQDEVLADFHQQLRDNVCCSNSSGRWHSVTPLSMEEPRDIGLRLVHILLACAEAVAREDCVAADDLICQLQKIVSVSGNSMQRVAAYFTIALRSRLTGTGNKWRGIDPACSEEVVVAYQIFYQVCPYIKFSHFTSNQAILEAFDGEDRVHIVDLDILHGYQWPAFLQALAVRPGGAPHVRITGIGMSLKAVEATGNRLADVAASLHIPFQFHPVGEGLENVKAYMLERRIGEALAVNSVNCLHTLLYESLIPLIGVLHMVREQAPKIFTLVEQQSSDNSSFFLGRFLEALHYYSAVFDSLDATLPRNSLDRTKVEQVIFARNITNIVACEGSERLERHEKLDRWRKIMEGVGFSMVNLSSHSVNQSKLLLGLYPCDGYILQEDEGSLLLGWQDRLILAASAWHC